MNKGISLLAMGMAALGLLKPGNVEGHEGPTPGALLRIGPEGEAVACPLRHTDVNAEISGPVVRVRVKQLFENQSDDKLEAIYTFPLGANGAVDAMTIRIGEKVVKGSVKERGEAQRIYSQARAQGKLAGLLNQERPNVFVQNVANIPPRAKVEVEISYVETLAYNDGQYEFVFPMVVGPRYSPQHNPGAFRNPPVMPQGVRAGHNIRLQVVLEGGVPVLGFESPTHEIVQDRASHGIHLSLSNKQEIPNKDFLLRYRVAGEQLAEGVLAHRVAGKPGHFLLTIAPPARPQQENAEPKELIFVIDTSGSMHGFPLDKAKEAMDAALASLRPQDTFNLITFAGDTQLLFPRPVPANPENMARARQFLQFRQGGGGTEMMKAIRAALAGSQDQEHVRVVCFMTDGYVGNEMEIVAEIQRHPNARVFSFGIGSSVNRFLLDAMAVYGRGEVAYVGLQDDGSLAAKRFHERVRTPVLTDIQLDWSGVEVSGHMPARVPDLFSAKPLVITGQYQKGGQGEVLIKGTYLGKPYSRRLKIRLPEAETGNSAIPALWARTKVAELTASDFQGMEHGNARAEVKQAITKLGVDYQILTPFTSFVAVQEEVVTKGGVTRTVEVPVEMPEGVSNLALGDAAMGNRVYAAAPMMAAPKMVTPMPLGRAEAVQAGSGYPGAVQERATEGRAPNLPQEAKRTQQKLSADLAAILQQNPQQVVEVRIFLASGATTADLLAACKAEGLEVITQLHGGRVLIGKGRAKLLATLANHKAVAQIVPR